MKILWESHAWEDYVYWQFQDKKTLKKINRIIPVFAVILLKIRKRTTQRKFKWILEQKN